MKSSPTRCGLWAYTLPPCSLPSFLDPLLKAVCTKMHGGGSWLGWMPSHAKGLGVLPRGTFWKSKSQIVHFGPCWAWKLKIIVCVKVTVMLTAHRYTNVGKYFWRGYFRGGPIRLLNTALGVSLPVALCCRCLQTLSSLQIVTASSVVAVGRLETRLIVSSGPAV